MTLLFDFGMLKFESAKYQVSVGNQVKLSVEQPRVVADVYLECCSIM